MVGMGIRGQGAEGHVARGQVKGSCQGGQMEQEHAQAQGAGQWDRHLGKQAQV